ncbi:MAG: glycoside hydrolase family 127 protein [Kiritimatiellae bacterium]|jgi:DUF1680 family protein|nr:glycoside hydrolase family 127 protein [Kiritimatiellia bacterium]
MQKTKQLSYKLVNIDGGFWYKLQKLNSNVIVNSVYKRFKETGRFDALKCSWKEGDKNKPNIFWDSDVAKWIEGVAYILQKEQNDELMDIVDKAIDTIEENQDVNGYFNSYFSVIEPENIFMRRDDHELYCAGHLIEAAVAYFEATGKDKFLQMMCRYADHIDKVFRIDGSADFITPGHEELELALIRLYKVTNEKRYLELSKFFIDKRGANDKDVFTSFGNAKYAQDHLPVREQTTAEGHSVRAVYLYNAMVDIAKSYDDNELFDACKAIFSNIIEKRMYITGGIGSTADGEAFTIDYDLPNQTAYAETCAALGLALFSQKMLLCEQSAVYADIAELAVYNGFLSGLSLDGKAFFYENPLEINPSLRERNSSTIKPARYPIMERKEVFDCSCCPPNIVRFIASIGNMLYSYSDDALFVNQYMESHTHFQKTEITQTTNYPVDGEIVIKYKGDFKTIAVRIPSWCTSFTINKEYNLKDGYAYIHVCAEDSIHLELDMPVQLIESNPKVQENSGRVAVKRGPIVYCLEGVDNGDNLRDVSINLDADFSVCEESSFTLPVLYTMGYRRLPDKQDSLYAPATKNRRSQKLKFIPYAFFANMGATEMIVWILKN